MYLCNTCFSLRLQLTWQQKPHAKAQQLPQNRIYIADICFCMAECAENKHLRNSLAECELRFCFTSEIEMNERPNVSIPHHCFNSGSEPFIVERLDLSLYECESWAREYA
jgi:hypothetical protein